MFGNQQRVVDRLKVQLKEKDKTQIKTALFKYVASADPKKLS